MRHAGNACHPLGRILADHIRQLVETDGVFSQKVSVDTAVADEQMQDAIEERDIRADPWRDMNVGLLRSRRCARIDDDQFRRIGTATPIEHAHPQNGVGAGRVVTDMEDAVRLVDVEVTARLPVRSERFLQRGRSGCGAQSRIAVRVRRAETCFCDEPERVVLLEKKLSRGVEADRARAVALAHLFRALDDEVHRLVPGRAP